jgi:tRNA(fMet)-specific endonuclease VapC
MRIVLDTNRYGDYVRGDQRVFDAIQAASSVFIPFVVLAELRAGFRGGTRVKENEAFLTRILQRPTVSALYPDGDTTHHFASIYQQLRRQGTPVPAHDIWIAALAVQHDVVLFTRDEHFKHIPQVARI